eukprot:PITA_07026
MVDEMASLHKNEAWDLVELPTGRKPISSKWVFKKKKNAEGNVDIYKALEQMDVKTTFLHGDLEEEIYMKQPKGFVVKGTKELCPKTQEEEEDMSRVPYASAFGSLMYVMVYTRTDIAHAMGVLSRFMSKPGKEHWTTVKRVFRYLRGTSDYGLCYQGKVGLEKVLDICGFVDADWARDLDQRRSTSRHVFNLFGGAVSWMSKKQSVVALSTTEA